MAPDRCLLVVKSVHHQNTARVAEAMAEVLCADVLPPDELPPASLEGCPLVGFGSGVYYGRMHEALLGFLSGLPDAPEPTKNAFVFSTSGLPFLGRIWHGRVRELLTKKGFRVIGEFSCRGFDTWGPLWLAGGLNRKRPNEHDLERARKFARRLLLAFRPSGADADAHR